MLLYLRPEIIAVIQAVCSSAPNDSRIGPLLPFRKSEGRIIPLIVLSSGLRSSNSTTVSLRNLWVHWRP
jgi:hypothetical protein